MNKKFLTLVTLLVIYAFLPGLTLAQNAAGITVAPIKKEFVIAPGQTITDTVRVVNPIAATMTLYPVVLNFHTDNDQGTPVFYSSNERRSTYALSEWIKPSKPFIRIAPNEEEVVEYTVTASPNAEPGGKYGVLLFSTEEPKLDQDISQIGVIGLVGTLLLATVPGDVREKLELTSFDTPSIIFRSPARLSLLFTNLGNVHVKPAGEIKIRNWSNEVVKTIAVNPDSGNVLPESQRRFDYDWKFDWKTVGKFSVSAATFYGANQLPLTTTRYLWVIPIWLIIAVVGLILLIILLIFISMMRRRKKRSEHKLNTRATSGPSSDNRLPPPRPLIR